MPALPVALATLGLSVCQLGAADGVNVNAPGVGVRVNEEHGGPSVVVGAPNAGVDVQTQGGPAVRVEAPRNAPPRIAGPSDASLIRDNRPIRGAANGRTTDGGITDPIIAGCGIPHRADGPTTRPLAATRQVMAEYRSHQPRQYSVPSTTYYHAVFRDPLLLLRQPGSLYWRPSMGRWSWRLGRLSRPRSVVVIAARQKMKEKEDRPAAVPCVMHLAPL